MQQNEPPKGFLDWSQDVRKMYFYQKSKAIYRLTKRFTDKYMERFRDRTVDQMVQAARSGKQNFVEGFADGVTSIEMKLKLINIGKGSLQELLEDYEDYLDNNNLQLWTSNHPRFSSMRDFCWHRNKPDEYVELFDKLNDEEVANLCLTLIHMTDRLLLGYLRKLEQDFIENGGLKETMYRIRTEYRNWKKYIDFYPNYKKSLNK